MEERATSSGKNIWKSHFFKHMNMGYHGTSCFSFERKCCHGIRTCAKFSWYDMACVSSSRLVYGRCLGIGTAHQTLIPDDNWSFKAKLWHNFQEKFWSICLCMETLSLQQSIRYVTWEAEKQHEKQHDMQHDNNMTCNMTTTWQANPHMRKNMSTTWHATWHQCDKPHMRRNMTTDSQWLENTAGRDFCLTDIARLACTCGSFESRCLVFWHSP